MWLMIALCFIPIVAGFIIWIFNKNIVWWEWLVTAAISAVIVMITYFAVLGGLTSDTETWSGRVATAVYEPRWIEEYQEQHMEYDDKGNVKRIYYTTEHRTHGPDWMVGGNFGAKSAGYSVSREYYQYLSQKFGGQKSVPGYRPGFDGGDPNDYHLVNVNDWLEPLNETYGFENRVKACANEFSFVKVPKEIRVFNYPKNKNSFHSDRIAGDAVGKISLFEWDCMNSRLGPVKFVNVILVGFTNSNTPQIMARYQEAKWIGGKKNDVVICYGQDSGRKWVYVFGWTEKELVKRNLETIVLTNPIGNNLIPLIENEIVANYEIKDWHKFEYLTIQPPRWAYILQLMLMIIAFVICSFCFSANNSNKE